MTDDAATPPLTGDRLTCIASTPMLRPRPGRTGRQFHCCTTTDIIRGTQGGGSRPEETTMKRRTFVMSGLGPLAVTACGGGGEDGSDAVADLQAPRDMADADARASAAAGSTISKSVRSAMRRAARYMDEHVSYRGGYVWAYLPDFSVTWGEMEAKRTMCWIQPPGTPTAGHSFLDAYHATGDELFYRAAERTALALVSAQHPAGGWNYIFDFARSEERR